MAAYAFYEFFSGGGMARLGLGSSWRSVFANDWCEKKGAAYVRNFPGDEVLLREDVSKLSLRDLPGIPDLIWGSFPCQDLSLAGAGAGLSGERSGVFWPFWRLVEGLIADGRGPSLIVLENVVGTLTSHKGRDFRAIMKALSGAGFRFGALVINAAHFIPQSRPRLFVIGVASDVDIPANLKADGPADPWHSAGLRKASNELPMDVRLSWIWWRLPRPQRRETVLADILESDGAVRWNPPAVTARLLSLMSPTNLEKVRVAKAARTPIVGTVYKRTRVENGIKVQRAEVRFDGISGCLRTPEGGSSRQTILAISGNSVRSRLLSAREAARLMGLPECYALPQNYNEAYHLAGDGVVVPVVSWLEEHLLRKLIERKSTARPIGCWEALGANINA
jgi:DNA (cytosine-5)-methyltransferase 1